jgi:hypothetical protein
MGQLALAYCLLIASQVDACTSVLKLQWCHPVMLHAVDYSYSAK